MINISKDQKILEPYDYVTQIGGKKIRLCMGIYSLISAVILSDMFADKLD
jgi:hypothetical protein